MMEGVSTTIDYWRNISSPCAIWLHEIRLPVAENSWFYIRYLVGTVNDLCSLKNMDQVACQLLWARTQQSIGERNCTSSCGGMVGVFGPLNLDVTASTELRQRPLIQVPWLAP